MRMLLCTILIYASTVFGCLAQGTNLPMAGNATQCSDARYNHNNGICHSIGTPQPSIPIKEKPIDRINDQLTTIGNLSAVDLNPQGYPIMGVECERSGNCVDSTGTPIGTVKEVAVQMFPVKRKDITIYKFHCNVICTDRQGNIIGRAPN